VRAAAHSFNPPRTSRSCSAERRPPTNSAGHGDQMLKLALTLAVAGFAAAYAAVFGPR
jgi:hypothetical protein